MEDRNYIMIDGVRYHADRPADCRFCQFWKNRRRGCILGRENCYYLAQVIITEEERKCEGCRYAVGRPLRQCLLLQGPGTGPVEAA